MTQCVGFGALDKANPEFAHSTEVERRGNLVHYQSN